MPTDIYQILLDICGHAQYEACQRSSCPKLYLHVGFHSHCSLSLQSPEKQKKIAINKLYKFQLQFHSIPIKNCNKNMIFQLIVSHSQVLRSLKIVPCEIWYWRKWLFCSENCDAFAIFGQKVAAWQQGQKKYCIKLCTD